MFILSRARGEAVTLIKQLSLESAAICPESLLLATLCEFAHSVLLLHKCRIDHIRGYTNLPQHGLTASYPNGKDLFRAREEVARGSERELYTHFPIISYSAYPHRNCME